MKKIYVFLFICLGIIGLVSAGIVLKNTQIIGAEEVTRYEGVVTFTIDGKTENCTLNEPNMDIEDDVQDCINRKYAGKTATNIEDWTGRTLQEATIDGVVYKSFDSKELQDKQDAYEASLLPPVEEDLGGEIEL